MGLGLRSFASQIYLFAIAHINLVLIAFDLPTIFQKSDSEKWG